MSNAYRAIDWNRQKRRYDLHVAGMLALVLIVIGAVTLRISPHSTVETLVLRGSAICAFLLLHVILCIGPLSRLDPRFLPLLYNRRHLGVTLFLFGLVHATFATIQFHALGNENPLVSVFTAYAQDYRPFAQGRVNIAHVPFEPFGAVALVILFFLAATSHDFWLRNLGASVWKALHLGVYLAYGLLLAHVAFGALQSERSVVYPFALASGFFVVAALHLAAARREALTDASGSSPSAALSTEVAVCSVHELVDGRGKLVIVGGVRIAVFRVGDRVFATSNVCRHQGGPLGEGRIVDGCITCPWHGWSYQPEDGCSPPPFQERIDTFPTRVVDGRVLVRPVANPLGTHDAGAQIGYRPESSARTAHGQPSLQGNARE